MENSNTQIREADNKVKIEGYVKEVKLEDKDDIISGDIVIYTGENSEIPVSVYTKKVTNNGTENKAYKGLQTVMSEFVSIASVMEKGQASTVEEALPMATRVRVTNGKLGLNEFYSNDELVSNPRVSANFFKHVTDDSFEPKADFEIECYFTKIHKEIKKDEETGRLILDTIVPLYGGKVVPFIFVAEGDIADYLEGHYVEKKTGCIAGDIVNTVERTVTHKAGFGKAREDVKVNFTRELKVTGGDEEQYDDDDTKKVFTTEQIQAAWKVRETETLPELLKKAKDKKGSNTAKANNKASTSKAPEFKF